MMKDDFSFRIVIYLVEFFSRKGYKSLALQRAFPYVFAQSKAFQFHSSMEYFLLRNPYCQGNEAGHFSGIVAGKSETHLGSSSSIVPVMNFRKNLAYGQEIRRWGKLLCEFSY